MQPTTLVKQLASSVQAYRNCVENGNDGWRLKHNTIVSQLVNDLMPSGSGWDCGTKIDLDASHADKLIFYGSFHHMNDAGMYDGWTEHRIIVTPSFNGVNIRITGRDRNQIKYWLHEGFSYALATQIVWDVQAERWRNEKFVGQPTIS